MSLRTDKPTYAQAARFWTRSFALDFSLGVASGIVVEFQSGTNWATFGRIPPTWVASRLDDQDY